MKGYHDESRPSAPLLDWTPPGTPYSGAEDPQHPILDGPRAMSPQESAFRAFHHDNPDVYRLFVKFAQEAAARRPRFSARTVLHRIRWYTSIETTDPDGFKVNDHWSPYYARLFERDFPEHVGFFEKRGSHADEMEQ